MTDFSKEECLTWSSHRLINPRTGHAIKEGGPMYQAFEKACASYSSNEIKDLLEKNNKIFHASQMHLETVLPHFKNGSPVENKFSKHIQNALSTKKKPIPFSRTFNSLVSTISMDDDISYEEMAQSSKIRELSLYNCHDGQRKLTLGFLEFIAKSMMRLACQAKDLFIVYAGSSGLASAIALTLFPELQLVLYDPEENTTAFLPSSIKEKTTVIKTKPNPNQNIMKNPLIIFTDKAGWFNDNSVKYCKNVLFPMTGKKHLLFVSDIRAETGEKDIVKDMQSQMRWTMMFKCDMFMHKFRLPYFDQTNQTEIKHMYEDIEHIYPYLKPKFTVFNKEEKANPKAILYLDGDMMIQPFGPQRTTEFRLIGQPHATKGFSLRYYNVEKIENQIAIFNAIYRGYATFRHEGIPLNSKNALSSSFEKLAEFDILLSCVQAKTKKEKEAEAEADELKKHYDILNSLITEIVHEKSNVDMCKYSSLMKALRKSKQNYKDVVPLYLQNIFESL